MRSAVGGLRAYTLGRVVEHQQLVGRQWQQRISASAAIGKLDLARITIVEHDNRADVATAQEHGLAALEVRGARVFEQSHSTSTRRSPTRSPSPPERSATFFARRISL